MKEKPLVSIITPVYNAETFIEASISSVINQTYPNWEMLLVDDRSKDNSVEIINRFAKEDNRIKLFQLKKNSGSGVARNHAIKEAKGTIIAFLDGDDIWLPNKLEVHVAFMIENNAAFSHTSYGYINEQGDRIGDTFHVSKKPVSYTDALKRTEISCLTAMYNASIIGKMYMPDLRRKQDYALWLSILKKGYNSIPLDKELAFYRQNSNSATSKKYKLILGHYRFLRKQEKLSIPKSIYYLIHWGAGGILKYYINLKK